MEFESVHMQSVAVRHDESYDGRKHGSYCNNIKNATDSSIESDCETTNLVCC